MAQTASELSKLPKDSLIKMAASQITEPSFDVKDFSAIEVWLVGDELSVIFKHAVRFIPKRGQFIYATSVDVVTGSTSSTLHGESGNDFDIPYYKPPQYQDKIKFVFDAINNSDGEVGKIPEGELPDGTMTIREESSYYDVEVDSHTTHSYYKVKKATGKIYDAGHKHYSRGEAGESRRKRIY